MQCNGSYEEEEEEEDANKAVQCPMLWRQSRSMRCCIYIYIYIMFMQQLPLMDEQTYIERRNKHMSFIPCVRRMYYSFQFQFQLMGRPGASKQANCQPHRVRNQMQPGQATAAGQASNCQLHAVCIHTRTGKRCLYQLHHTTTGLCQSAGPAGRPRFHISTKSTFTNRRLNRGV